METMICACERPVDHENCGECHMCFKPIED